MEFSILYAIQNLHSDFLDSLILALTKIAGSYGQIWLVLGAVLLIFKKTRRCGFSVIISYALVFVIGQYGLKDLIARARPCHIDTAVELLIERPSSYSCPSTHSAWAFAAAASVFMYKKGWGIVVGIAALMIAFSRLYLFVHFPTDVLFGAVLGIAAGFISAKIVNIFRKKTKKEQKSPKWAQKNALDNQVHFFIYTGKSISVGISTIRGEDPFLFRMVVASAGFLVRRKNDFISAVAAVAGDPAAFSEMCTDSANGGFGISTAAERAGENFGSDFFISLTADYKFELLIIDFRNILFVHFYILLNKSFIFRSHLIIRGSGGKGY